MSPLVTSTSRPTWWILDNSIIYYTEQLIGAEYLHVMSSTIDHLIIRETMSCHLLLHLTMSWTHIK